MVYRLTKCILVLRWLLIVVLLGTVYAMEEARAYLRSIPRVDFSRKDDLKKSDVIFKFFKDASVTTGKVLTEETVKDENLDKTIPTVLIIHGWTSNDSSPWYAPLRDELFKVGPHNVFYLDWSIAGNRSYSVSCANTIPTGKIIAEFLVASGVQPSKTHLIGHSLGSHLTGYIGKSVYQITGKKIGRITALDPAGPCWENKQLTEEERLNPNDADFVDVIHTDIFYSGYIAPIGHVDFYPNDGKHQPGCPPRSVDRNCSHARSTLYFIESIGEKKKAYEADYKDDDSDVILSTKPNGKELIFGYHTNTTERGIYKFETNSEKPFLG